MQIWQHIRNSHSKATNLWKLIMNLTENIRQTAEICRIFLQLMDRYMISDLVNILYFSIAQQMILKSAENLKT